MAKPRETEYHSFYAGYVNACPETDLMQALIQSLAEWEALVGRLPEELGDYAYAAQKWTVKQLLAHCIDTERVFQYRVLRIAREPEAQLSGFDEDAFADANTAKSRTPASLCEEMKTVRQSTLFLFESLDPNQLKKTGKADGKSISIRALGFIMAGHIRHHLSILEQRYLNT